MVSGLWALVDPDRALRVGTLAAALHVEGSDVPPFDEMMTMMETRRTVGSG